MPSTSSPPNFFGGQLSIYSPLFVLSLLLQLIVLISLPSWPFEALSFSLVFFQLLLNLLLSFVSIHSWISSSGELETAVFISIGAGFSPLTRSYHGRAASSTSSTSLPPIVERLLILDHPVQLPCCHTLSFSFGSCLIRSLVFRPC